MLTNWYLIFTVALVESFLVSIGLTALMRWISNRWNFVDHPGDRKIHTKPIPVLGGVAIYLTFNGVIFGNLIMLESAGYLGFDWLKEHVVQFLDDSTWRPLLGVVAGGFVIFVLGVVDDLRALKPEAKLVGQIVAALILVLSGIRLDLFIEPLLENFSVSLRFSVTPAGYRERTSFPDRFLTCIPKNLNQVHAEFRLY